MNLRSGRQFIAQLQLHHSKLYERREDAKDEYAKLRAIIADASPAEHVDGVLRLVMEQLSATRGKCRWDAVEGLATAAELEQTEASTALMEQLLSFADRAIAQYDEGPGYFRVPASPAAPVPTVNETKQAWSVYPSLPVMTKENFREAMIATGFG